VEAVHTEKIMIGGLGSVVEVPHQLETVLRHRFHPFGGEGGEGIPASLKTGKELVLSLQYVVNDVRLAAAAEDLSGHDKKENQNGEDQQGEEEEQYGKHFHSKILFSRFPIIIAHRYGLFNDFL
jgi:hypothetical protein